MCLPSFFYLRLSFYGTNKSFSSPNSGELVEDEVEPSSGISQLELGEAELGSIACHGWQEIQLVKPRTVALFILKYFNSRDCFYS